MSSPLATLQTFMKNKNATKSLDSEEFADLLDKEDPLRRFRDKFQFPTLGSIPCGKQRYVFYMVYHYNSKHRSTNFDITTKACTKNNMLFEICL